jgi:hypothetical protein
MPSDILGSEILDETHNSKLKVLFFKYCSKTRSTSTTQTQAALLEAMRNVLLQ